MQKAEHLFFRRCSALLYFFLWIYDEFFNFLGCFRCSLLKFSTSFALDVLQQPLALLKSFSAENAQSIAEGILNALVSGIAAQRHIIAAGTSF